MDDALIFGNRTAEEAWNNQELYGNSMGNVGGMDGVNGLIVILHDYPDPLTDGSVKDGVWTIEVMGQSVQVDMTSLESPYEGGTNAALLFYMDFVANTDVDYEDLVTALNSTHPANGLSLGEGQKKTIEALYVLNKAGIGGDCSTDEEKTELLTAFANFAEMDSGAQDAVMDALKDVDVTVTASSDGRFASGAQETATDSEKAIAQMVADGNPVLMTSDWTNAMSGADKFVTISEGGTADDYSSTEITAMKAAGEAWLSASADERQALLDSGIVTQKQADAWVAAAWVDHVGNWSPPDGESYLVWAAKAEGQGFSPQQWAGFTHNVSNFQGGTYYYTHTRYHYITDLRDSVTADELEAAHDMGVLTDEQWDMIQMSYAFDTTDGNQYEKADALAFIYGSMSDADRTRTIAVLSLGGDDSEDLAQWIVDSVESPLNINDIFSYGSDTNEYEAAGLALDFTSSENSARFGEDSSNWNSPSFDRPHNVIDFRSSGPYANAYEAAGFSANFTSTEISARYGEASSIGNQIQVMAMLYSAGVSEEDFATAMVSFDRLSDLDQAYIIEQAKTRDTKQSDFFGDLGLAPDYSQSSLTYTSGPPSSAQSAIAD